jgi:hypothetical protein
VTNWRTMIEKDYLGAWDLATADGAPRPYTLEIVKVTSVSLKTRETGNKGKRKLVIQFARADKRFVCNTTNAETIESLYGPDIEGWIGKRVTLYQADVRNPKGSGTIKGIRVQAKRPGGPAEQVISRPVDPAMREEQDQAFNGREPGSDDT